MGNTILTVIGSGDAFSAQGRGNTCFLIQSAGTGIAIDFGATALSGLKKYGYSSNDVDIIVLTHFHGDHFGGMPFLLLDCLRLERSKQLTIISPLGGRKRIEALFSLLYPGSEKSLDRLDVCYLEFNGKDSINSIGVLVETFPAVHSPETLPHGVRIHVNGHVISYTGDTEWIDTIKDIVADAHLAICECTFFRKEEKNHLNYTRLKEEARAFTCKKLLLTHFDEEMLEHLKEIPFELAKDGLVISINAR